MVLCPGASVDARDGGQRASLEARRVADNLWTTWSIDHQDFRNDRTVAFQIGLEGDSMKLRSGRAITMVSLVASLVAPEAVDATPLIISGGGPPYQLEQEFEFRLTLDVDLTSAGYVAPGTFAGGTTEVGFYHFDASAISSIQLSLGGVDVPITSLRDIRLGDGFILNLALSTIVPFAPNKAVLGPNSNDDEYYFGSFDSSTLPNGGSYIWNLAQFFALENDPSPGPELTGVITEVVLTPVPAAIWPLAAGLGLLAAGRRRFRAR
jgi:hypothetical protein